MASSATGSPAPTPRRRGPLLASIVLLLAVAGFCASTRWGRMYPSFVANTTKVWSAGHVLNAADRRLRFYDETYPVLLYIRQSTPPDAVVMLPPEAFIKEQVAQRRPAGEDLIPLLGSASSAYAFLYPRVPVHYGTEAPMQDVVDWLLVWDHWGLEKIDPSKPKTDDNRVKLFSAPLADAAERSAAAERKRVPRCRDAGWLDQTGPDRWVTPGLLLGLLVLAALGDGLYRLLRRARALPLAERGRAAGGAHAETSAAAREPRDALDAPEDLRERVGWRVLLALASVPWLVIVLDLTGIPIGAGSLGVCAAVVVLSGWTVDRDRLRRALLHRSAGSRAAATGAGDGTSPEPAAEPRDPPDPPGGALWPSLLRSPAAWLLGLGAASLVLLSLIQVMILPERNYDALVGWDLVGKVMSFEGELRSSVFTRIVYNAQAIYAPFTASNLGFGYIFHPAIHRLWIPLLTGGFLLLLHRRVRLWTGSPAAASLAAFIVLLPQAFLAQLTMAMTDLPSMAYAALGLFATVDLLRGRGGFAAPAMLFLAASTARTENLLLAVGVSGVCLLKGAAWPRFRRRPGAAARGSVSGPARGPAGVSASGTARLGGPPLPGRWRALWIAGVSASFFVFWNFFYVKGQFGYDPAAHFRPFDFDPARMAEVLRRAAQIIAMPQVFGEFWVMAALLPVLWALGRWRATAPLFGGGEASHRGRSDGAAGTTEGRGTTRPDDLSGLLLLITLAALLCYLAFFYMWDPVLNPLWSMEHTYKRGFFRFMPGIVAGFLALPIIKRVLRRCDAASDSGP